MFKHDEAAKVDLFSEEGIKEIAAFSGGIPKYALEFSSIDLGESIKAKRDSPLIVFLKNIGTL